MFGARKSVTALFMMRRSTKKSDIHEKEKSMLAQFKKDVEVVDITDDNKDILEQKEESKNPFSEVTISPKITHTDS